MTLWVPFTRRWLPTTLLVLAGSLLFARLGVWQLDRLAQRRASNARITYVTSLPPAVLPSTEDLGAQEYRAVRVQGIYDFDNQVALRNQARDGQYGYHLLTPLVLQDNENAEAKSAVLVDRGWIPATGNQRPEDWRKFDAAGIVVVEGVIRLGHSSADPVAGESAPAVTDEPTNRFALTIDPAGFSRRVGYAMPSFYVQASRHYAETTLPAAELPLLNLGDGPHVGYAVQWFGFAVMTLAAYAVHVHRRETGAT